MMGNNPSHFKGPKIRWKQSVGTTARSFSRSSMQRPGRKAGSSACRPRRSGNMPAARVARRGIALGMMSRRWGKCVVYCELGQHDASCRQEEGERLGALRNAWERMGVVPGLVWQLCGRGDGGRSNGGCNGLGPRGSRRGLVLRRRVLPVGAPRRTHARGTGTTAWACASPEFRRKSFQEHQCPRPCHR